MLRCALPACAQYATLPVETGHPFCVAELQAALRHAQLTINIGARRYATCARCLCWCRLQRGARGRHVRSVLAPDPALSGYNALGGARPAAASALAMGLSPVRMRMDWQLAALPEPGGYRKITTP